MYWQSTSILLAGNPDGVGQLTSDAGNALRGWPDFHAGSIGIFRYLAVRLQAAMGNAGDAVAT